MISLAKSFVYRPQLCLTLCDPMDCSLPGSYVHGILQARILEWVVVAFSRGSSQPRDWTQVSHTARGFFTIWTSREAQTGVLWALYSVPHYSHVRKLCIIKEGCPKGKGCKLISKPHLDTPKRAHRCATKITTLFQHQHRGPRHTVDTN